MKPKRKQIATWRGVRMRRALEMFVVEGIKTSIPLQRKIMMDPDFIAGRLDTHFLDRFATSHAG